MRKRNSTARRAGCSAGRRICRRCQRQTLRRDWTVEPMMGCQRRKWERRNRQQSVGKNCSPRRCRGHRPNHLKKHCLQSARQASTRARSCPQLWKREIWLPDSVIVRKGRMGNTRPTRRVKPAQSDIAPKPKRFGAIWRRDANDTFLEMDFPCCQGWVGTGKENDSSLPGAFERSEDVAEGGSPKETERKDSCGVAPPALRGP